MFGHVAPGANYPVATPGGTGRSFVMQTLIALVRGLPGSKERQAAEGDALPL